MNLSNESWPILIHVDELCDRDKFEYDVVSDDGPLYKQFIMKLTSAAKMSDIINVIERHFDSRLPSKAYYYGRIPLRQALATLVGGVALEVLRHDRALIGFAPANDGVCVGLLVTKSVHHGMQDVIATARDSGSSRVKRIKLISGLYQSIVLSEPLRSTLASFRPACRILEDRRWQMEGAKERERLQSTFCSQITEVLWTRLVLSSIAEIGLFSNDLAMNVTSAQRQRLLRAFLEFCEAF